MSTTGKRVGVFASSGIASVALVHWGASAPAENRSGHNRKPVAAADPESLAREIAERFGAPSRIADGASRSGSGGRRLVYSALSDPHWSSGSWWARDSATWRSPRWRARASACLNYSNPLARSLLISITFTLLGFLIAWRMDRSQGFHAVMNLLPVPLWMLSGASLIVTVASAAVANQKRGRSSA